MNRDDIPIYRLTAQDTVVDGDQFPVWSGISNDTRKVSGKGILNYILANIGVAASMVTQYSAPSASPFTVTINQVNGVSYSVWLVLTPIGTLANGTINLPPSGTAFDRQEVLVNCTQAVTTLSVLASGLNVTGAPTTLTANESFRMRYDALTTTWYKVAQG